MLIHRQITRFISKGFAAAVREADARETRDKAAAADDRPERRCQRVAGRDQLARRAQEAAGRRVIQAVRARPLHSPDADDCVDDFNGARVSTIVDTRGTSGASNVRKHHAGVCAAFLARRSWP